MPPLFLFLTSIYLIDDVMAATSHTFFYNIAARALCVDSAFAKAAGCANACANTCTGPITGHAANQRAHQTGRHQSGESPPDLSAPHGIAPEPRMSWTCTVDELSMTAFAWPRRQDPEGGGRPRVEHVENFPAAR